jgi:hypothetical protein
MEQVELSIEEFTHQAGSHDVIDVLEDGYWETVVFYDNFGADAIVIEYTWGLVKHKNSEKITVRW